MIFITAIICGYPSSIENGRVIVINETVSYNSIVEYHCIPRYERVGPFIRKCTETGKWSGNEPKCECKCPNNFNIILFIKNKLQ